MTSLDTLPSALSSTDGLASEVPPRALPVANILIVDDDEHSRYALERTLEGPGLNIVAVESAEKAFRCLLAEDFALILLDVRMPHTDGYEAASLIRRRERSRHIPIIFLTAVDKEEIHIFRGYTAGAVDYVFKPVEPLVLKSKVAVFVELYRQTEMVRRDEEMKRLLERETLTARMERQRAEQALRVSESRQMLILDALPLALYTAKFVEPFAGPSFIGSRFEKIGGFPATRFDAEGRFWIERILPADRERVLSDVGRLKTEGSFTTEYRWRRADDSYGVFLDRATAVPKEDGGNEVYGIWVDVTEQRQLQEQLVQAQKMDAVGRLTGGIVHDFSNMLTTVLGNLDLLRHALDPDSLAYSRADQSLQSALRCSDLTQRLLSFSRQKSLQPDIVNVNEVIERMMDILNRTLGIDIDIQLDLTPDVWPIFVDRSQIESTLLNLAINARDALPSGGRVRVATTNIPTTAKAIDKDFLASTDDYVLLTVSDNGIGMPRTVRERAFEPFYTTKEPGKGTGLGLSMARVFIEQSGGSIRIESAEGQGTSIELLLRRAKEIASQCVAVGETSDGLPRARADEIVLVVDDDPLLLNVTAESLREFGYKVLEARNANGALSLFAENRIDLLFSDIAMPGGVTGHELAKEVGVRYPDTRILLTSGYTSRASFGAEPPSGRLRYLRKPYRTSELATAVREALDNPARVLPAEQGQ